MVVAERADTLPSPVLFVCCPAFFPIQDRGDSLVWFDPRQQADDLHEIIVGDIPMLTGANLLELHLGVIPALPMQYELPILWGDPRSLPEHKKRLLRVALKEIIATCEGDTIRVL